MWTRSELKAKGKERFLGNYIGAVIAAILVFLGAASSGSAGRSSSKVSDAVSSSDNPIVALATVIAILVGVVIVLAISFIIKVFFLNPLTLGGYRFFVLNHDEKPSLKTLLFAFNSAYYGNIVKIMLVRDIKVILWTLLFVIPGIYKQYEYRMIPFLVAENPYIELDEAFVVSKGMMMGNKLDALVLDFSFIGWWILVGITGGIAGIFYVNPYVASTNTELYFALKD